MSTERDSLSRFFYPLLWISAITIALVLAACNMFLGELNQDEGWYLYAARLVTQGKLPYVDFATTQGPVMPFVYALAQPVVARWGMLGGRLFTAILGFLCSLSAAWLASRLVTTEKKRYAALMAFCLVAVNVHQSYFCAMVKTYSLTALLIMLGFVALSFAGDKRGSIAAFLSGVLLALAGGTRTSAGVALPIVFVCLLVARRQKHWLWFGLGGALTCCIIFVPFMLRAPAAVRFALFDYHAGREIGGITRVFAYKAGFVSRVVQAYFVAIGAWLTALLYILVNRRNGTEARGDIVQSRSGSLMFTCNLAPIEVAMWLSVLGVTMVHFCAPFPYDDYQTLIFPLFTAAVGVMLVRLAGDSKTELLIALSVFLLCTASAFSSPINQKWFIDERDRIWWPLKEQTSLKKLRETSECLRKLTKPGDMLLTQDTYLAVESGLSLPHGLEMGPFSYFPGWTRERATECRVLNREMMTELLETCGAPVAAFSGYGFAIQSPSITKLPEAEQAALWKTLDGRYKFFRLVEKFGAGGYDFEDISSEMTKAWPKRGMIAGLMQAWMPTVGFCVIRRAVIAILWCLLVVAAQQVVGQTLRYDEHREIEPPKYATLRLGPFYSDISFSQSVGYRYTEGTGTGINYLYGNSLGEVKTNGSEFPMISTLDFRNYLIIGKHTDLDVSLNVSYAHYPLKTEDDAFNVNLAQEGAVGNVSMEFNPTPFVKGTAYDAADYKVDYIDARGIIDRYGGQKYEHFDNTVGLNMDWLMAKDQNLALTLIRSDVLPRGNQFDDQKSAVYNETLAYEQKVNIFIVAGANSSFNQTSYFSTNRAQQTASESFSIFSNVKLTANTIASASLGYSTSSDPSQTTNVESASGTMIGQVSLKTQLSRQLSHSFVASRSQQGGFNSDFEIDNSYNYSLDWKGEDISSALHSTLLDVMPNKTGVSEYSDWTSGINATVPLVRGVTLLLSSDYDVRVNKNTGAVVSSDPELSNDYTTWTSQIGTSLALTRSVSFSTTVQHIERTSDSENLTYKMNIFSADLTYTHTF